MPPMKTFLFKVASCGVEPRLMEWDHFSREQAQEDMERKGYTIIRYVEEVTS